MTSLPGLYEEPEKQPKSDIKMEKITPRDLAKLVADGGVDFKGHGDVIMLLQAIMEQLGNDPSIAFRASNYLQMLAEKARAYASFPLEGLIRLAQELDDLGEVEAADEIDNLVSQVSSEDLSKMKNNIDKMNEKLEVALKTVQKSNGSPNSDPNIAALNPALAEKLANIANKLDSAGAFEQADMIDNFLSKYAGPVLPDVIDWKENKDKPDPYDYERHHSLIVREPKRDQERVDLEGRKEHHVDEYKDPENIKEAALRTRYSPDMTGVMLQRVGDDLWQDPITGKVYDFANGYTDNEGNFHPGGSIAAQTPDSSGYGIPHRIFDSRESIINRINN